MSFLLAAPIRAFGGAATEKIIAGGVTSLASKGPPSRILGIAALSGLEEGVREASESVATRFGIRSAGLDVSVADGIFGNFLLGALGGAPVTGVAGALQGRDEPPEEDGEDAASPLMLPPLDQAA